MTAGSWIYIGTQGILQGTYETFAEAGRQHFGTDDLTGRLVVTAGLGGMGGAQPLAATMNNGTFLGFDVDPTEFQERLETRYLDEIAPASMKGSIGLCDTKPKVKVCPSEWWPTQPLRWNECWSGG